MFRVVWAGDAKTVQLSWTHIRQEHMPNLIGAFGNRNADVFFSGFDAVEQAKFNAGGVLGKDGKVDTVPHPRRAQRIGVAEESPYRNHKRAAHLSGIESPLAIRMVKSMKILLIMDRRLARHARARRTPKARAKTRSVRIDFRTACPPWRREVLGSARRLRIAFNPLVKYH